MTITKISINDFRNISALEYKPADVNVIYGQQRTGKTNLLDAIALTDSSDQEFHAMIKSSYGEESKTMSLANLIKLNFFSHLKALESFRIKLFFKDTRNKLFEIWKTDEVTRSSIEGSRLQPSPYILVFDSADPKQLMPRAISYSRLENSYRTLNVSSNQWPLHYIGSDNKINSRVIHKVCIAIFGTTNIKYSFQSYINHFDELESICIGKTSHTDGIMVKTKDRLFPIPLYGCPNSVARILTILIFLNAIRRSYFLIDDIERHLSDREIKWLIPEILRISEERKIQLFISTRKNEIVNIVEQYAKGMNKSINFLNLKSTQHFIQKAFA